MAFVFPTTGLMMIGLALFKSGFLSGARSLRAYAVTLSTAATALVVVAWLEWGQVMNGAESPLAGGVDFLLNPLIGLGYASVLILLWKAGHAGVLSPLAAAGRMAFTNYLTQSLMMTTLFYGGRGFGLMGQVDRPALWGIVVAVWALQLVWSALWLRRFQMGPLEWLWCSLTEGRRLPIRRTA